MVEEKDYRVVFNIQADTVVNFSPIERATALSERDAVENAIGLFPDSFFQELSKTFEDYGFKMSVGATAREIVSHG